MKYNLLHAEPDFFKQDLLAMICGHGYTKRGNEISSNFFTCIAGGIPVTKVSMPRCSGECIGLSVGKSDP